MNLNRLPYSRYLLPMSFIAMLLVSAFAISSLVNLAAAEVNTGTQYAYFEVDPATSVATNGGSFTIDIYAKNAPVSSAYQLTLDWDANDLNATAVAGCLVGAWPIFATPLPADQSITVGQTMLMGGTFSGNVKLCNVTFLVTAAAGFCVLNLTDTILVDSNGVETHHPNTDGFFKETTAAVEDIAVIEVKTDVSQVAPAGTVNINVTVKNEGDTQQSFTVKVYADVVTHDPNDPDVVQVGDEITIPGTWYVVNLASGAQISNASITWTPGDIPGGKCTKYYISAEAIFANDDDPHDNILIDDGVKILVDHDIKIVDMVKYIKVYEKCPVCDYVNTALDVNPISGLEQVYRDEVIYIDVTVMNDGQNQESFNVTIDVDGINVDWLTTNVTLPYCNTTTLTFEWYPLVDPITPDYAKWPKGDYNITATVAPVTGERLVDQADNTKSNLLTLLPKCDWAVSAVATVTPEIWVGDRVPYWTGGAPQVAKFRISVMNLGTETETFSITVFVDHLRCRIEGYDATNGKIEYTMAPGSLTNVTTYTWLTQGTWVDPLPGEDIYLPTYKYYPAWMRYDNVTTDFAIKSEVAAGSWTPIVTAENEGFGPPGITANNRAEGLPIIIKAIPADLNLDGVVDAADIVILGKLIGDRRPLVP